MRGTLVTGLLDAPGGPRPRPGAGRGRPPPHRLAVRRVGDPGTGPGPLPLDGAGPPVRPGGLQPAAAGELGLWLSCRGQEGAQVGSVRALRACDHISRRTGSTPSACAAASHPANCCRVARVHARRLGPGAVPDAHLQPGAGHPDAARDRLRHGGGGRRRRRGRGRRTSVTARPARATRTRRSTGRPSARRPSSSSARTTSGPSRHLDRAQMPRAAAPARRRLRAPRRLRRRQRRARRARGDRDAAAAVRAGGGPAFDRGDDLPDGRAQHLRRPPPLPGRRRGGAWRRRDPIARARRPAGRAGLDRRGVPRRARAPRRTTWPPNPRGRACALPPATLEDTFRNTLTEETRPARRASGRQFTRLQGVVRMTEADHRAPRPSLTLAGALNAGLRQALADDPTWSCSGRGHRTARRRLPGDRRPAGRVRPGGSMDTPLAESGIVGIAIGLALRGYRPVCEIQFDGFIYPAFDQIVSQLAKMHARSRGALRLPVTIRVPVGGGIGAVEHHSESNEAYFCHTAGLRVVACANPAGRAHHDPAGHRLRRPGDLLRTQAALLGQGAGRTPARPGPRCRLDRARDRPARQRRHRSSPTGPRSRAALDAAPIAAGEEGRSRRSDRPAVAVAAGLPTP